MLERIFIVALIVAIVLVVVVVGCSLIDQNWWDCPDCGQLLRTTVFDCPACTAAAPEPVQQPIEVVRPVMDVYDMAQPWTAQPLVLDDVLGERWSSAAYRRPDSSDCRNAALLIQHQPHLWARGRHDLRRCGGYDPNRRPSA